MATVAISVIIPLYNAEKYIAVCLESILAQTFQNYELILVDDCSTDSSCAIVKQYAPKFGGRLKLIGTEKNSGSGAIPRNIGLEHACGKYVFNMDNDDIITQTALEELVTLAENYDADVVYCGKYYVARADLSEVFIYGEHKRNFVTQPTFETNDLEQRVLKILDEKFWVTPWSKLVRRDLLIKHKIFFPPCKISDDDIWTYELIFCAEKILRVPNIIYINRRTEDSITRNKKTPSQELIFWLDPVVVALKSFDDFMDKIEFFRQNSSLRLAMLDYLINGRALAQLNRFCSEMTPVEIYETIRRNFKSRLGEYDVLIAYLLTLVHVQRKNLKLRDEQITQIKNM